MLTTGANTSYITVIPNYKITNSENKQTKEICRKKEKIIIFRHQLNYLITLQFER